MVTDYEWGIRYAQRFSPERTGYTGGGFKHGQHLAFDRDHNYPLPNLFVNMIQRLGIESDKFASSTGTMRGLA